MSPMQGAPCRALGMWTLEVVSALAFVACVGPRPLRGPSAGASTSTSPVAAAVPSGPGAETYTTVATESRSSDSLALRLMAEIDGWGARPGRVSLVHDARLDQVAYDIALMTEEWNAPPSDAIAFLLSHYGVVVPEPNLILIKGSQGAEDSAVIDLRRQWERIPASHAWQRVGIGVRRRGADWIAVIAFHEQSLELRALPRRIPSGGQAAIAGTVRLPFHSPEVLVTLPKGTVQKLAIAGSGGAVVARLECAQGDGVYQVEVSAEDARGPTVLANFPVYCGIDAPSSFHAMAGKVARVTNPLAAEKEILGRIDQDRLAHGLPVLVRDPRLAEIARAYSREMAGTGEVAHLSMRSGSAVDRVRAAGIVPFPRVIAENVGRDYSAADAERGFMSSPGHRDNILSSAITHVGVGVAQGQVEGGVVPLFFTQLFVGWR